jgi:spore germination protein GerM
MWYDKTVAKRRNYGRNSGGRNSGGQIIDRRAAGRRHTRKSNKTKIPGGLIFWAAFLVLITGLFFANRDHIRESLENTRFLEKINAPVSGGNADPGRQPEPAGSPAREPESSRERDGGERQPSASPAGTGQTSMVQSPPRPIEQYNSPSSPAENRTNAGTQAAGTPVTAVNPAPPAAPVTTPDAGRPSYTDQILYFIRVNNDGDIIRSRTTRRLPVSGTPLQDTLEALITGPDSAGEREGMLSLIPADTRVLSAVISGNTARINFSEEFQYNTAGMEGFIAQLIQVIWTATEFPNVQDVQILIEGNRIDHLGEGIPVWNPLNRQSF